MGAQVISLMWMNTTVNFQYRNGTTFPHALRALYSEGGIKRFYRGLVPALVQAPLSRFGDTAANTGMLTLLNSMESTKQLNVGLKTVFASAAAGAFRILLMPIDTFKTTMQVTGKFSSVVTKVKTSGFPVLFHGSLAAAGANFVGHFPWFATYNFVSEQIPTQETRLRELGRRAIIGICASVVSDTCSNSIRVVKVYRQSHPTPIPYPLVVSRIVEESGIAGLMFRGLETKILANSLQGVLFSILWKHFEEMLLAEERKR